MNTAVAVGVGAGLAMTALLITGVVQFLLRRRWPTLRSPVGSVVLMLGILVAWATTVAVKSGHPNQVANTAAVAGMLLVAVPGCMFVVGINEWVSSRAVERDR